MAGVLLLYTGVFLLYGMMDVLGLMPQEIVSAGLTLPGLLSKCFGDPVSYTRQLYRPQRHRCRYNLYIPIVFFFQNLDFMSYQLKRTTIVTFVHLSLPLLYCIGLSLVEPQVYTVSLSTDLTWITIDDIETTQLP